MSTLKVAAVQFDINWLDKQKNISQLKSMLQDLPQVDLLLLPETFSTGFSINVEGCEEDAINSDVLEWMKVQAYKLNAVVAGSILVKKKNKKVNRFYWVKPDGQIDFYDKRHLFRMGNEQNFVIAGKERKIFKIKDINILPNICYDLRFPVWSRNKNDYQLLINIANWPAARRNAWDVLLQARAIENQAYVIGVNRVGSDGNGVTHSGGTAVYNYLGETIAKIQDDQTGILFCELDFSELEKFKIKFPAYMDSDEFDIKI